MILVTESTRFSSAAAALLREAGSVRLADLDRSALLHAAADAEVLWIRLRHRIDREVLDAAPCLRLIASPTTGVNHIDLAETQRRGIEVVCLRGETDFLRQVHATAEHTLALMLGLIRKLPAAVGHVREGGWNRDLFAGGELHGKTVGIVGLGRVGCMVAQLALAFGARLLAYDITPEENTLPGVRRCSLGELLAESDIVSLHVNLGEQTEGFWGAEEFHRMKPGAFLINTARGELIDEQALLSVLRSGWLAGAALDVLAGEDSSGMASHPLVRFSLQHANLLITPHIGGCTAESMEQTELFLAQKLIARMQATDRTKVQTADARA